MDQQEVETLAARSRSSDPDQYVQALDQLETIIPELIELLQSPDEVVRADCAYALGQVGDAARDRIGPALLSLLVDEENVVRNQAVLALHLQPYPPALESLKQILHHDPDWVVRASAAEALGNYQHEDLVADLEQVLRNEEEEQVVRAYAALSLGLVADPAFRPQLDASIAGSISCLNLQSEILAASYRLGGQEHLSSLLDLLHTSDKDDVPLVLNAIQDLTERKYPPTLLIDAPCIREALNTVDQGVPLWRGHVTQILDNLSKLEQADR
jgi:HEAT repeat protein